MVGESNQKGFLIQIDALSFAEFEISEFEISRVDCTELFSDRCWKKMFRPFIDSLILVINNFGCIVHATGASKHLNLQVYDMYLSYIIIMPYIDSLILVMNHFGYAYQPSSYDSFGVFCSYKLHRDNNLYNHLIIEVIKKLV